jgi:hypothetical protein
MKLLLGNFTEICRHIPVLVHRITITGTLYEEIHEFLRMQVTLKPFVGIPGKFRARHTRHPAQETTLGNPPQVSHHPAHWIGLGANPGRRGERPATNRLSHGTAKVTFNVRTKLDSKRLV